MQTQASELAFSTGKLGNVSTWFPYRCFPFSGNTLYSYHTHTYCLTFARSNTFASAAAFSAAAFSAAALASVSAFACASAAAFASAAALEMPPQVSVVKSVILQ